MRAPGRLGGMERGNAAGFTVYLVEDSPAVRERVRSLLEEIPGVSAAGYADTAPDAIRGVVEAQPDVVLLDMQLRQGSGLDVLRALREQAPGVEVYMLTNFAAEPFRSAAKRLGARDVFDKSTEFGQVRELIARRAGIPH